VLAGSSAWYRVHEVSAAAQTLSFTPIGDGLRSSVVHATQPSKGSALLLPRRVEALPLVPVWAGRRLFFSASSLRPLGAAALAVRHLHE
jgi:hypothetical protein